MVFAYMSNRNGRIYYLHRALAKKNKMVMWYFSLSPKDGVEGFPVGFEVSENNNGYPLLKKRRINGST